MNIFYRLFYIIPLILFWSASAAHSTDIVWLKPGVNTNSRIFDMSADGSVYAGFSSTSMTFINGKTGTVLSEVNIYHQPYTIKLSDDNKSLYLLTLENGKLYLKQLDISKGVMVDSISFEHYNITASKVVISPDLKYILSVKQKKVVLLDTKTGKDISPSDNDNIQKSDIYDLNFSPDGKYIIGIQPEGISYWNTITRNLEKSIKSYSFDNKSQLLLSGDGSRMAIYNNSGNVIIYNGKTGDSITSYKLSNKLDDMLFSQDGTNLLIMTDNHISINNTASGDSVFTIKTDMNNFFIDVSANDILAVSGNKAVKFYDFKNLSQKAKVDFISGAAKLFFTHDNKNIIFKVNNEYITFSVDSGNLTSDLIFADFHGIPSYMPAAEKFFSVTGKSVRLYSLEGDDAGLYEFDSTLAYFNISPDAKVAAYSYEQSNKIFIELPSKNIIKTYDSTSILRFSNTGKYFTGYKTNDKEPIEYSVYDIASGNILVSFKESEMQAYGFSGDDKYFVLYKRPPAKQVQLFDLTTNGSVYKQYDNDDTTAQIKSWVPLFSSNNKYLVDAQMNGNIRVRDIAGGEIKNNVNKFSTSINDIAVSPDMKYLATSYIDGTVILYDINDWILGTSSDNNYEQNEQISIYPIPANKLVYISYIPLPGKNINLKIFNSLGTEIHPDFVAEGESQLSLNVSEFTPGVYFVRLMTGNEVYAQKAFIVK